jgi:hypothetical protein
MARRRVRLASEGGERTVPPAIVAEVDRLLRHLWIDYPHPDFRADAVIGKRDDELISGEDAHEILAVKRKAFELERASPPARGRPLSFLSP